MDLLGKSCTEEMYSTWGIITCLFRKITHMLCTLDRNKASIKWNAPQWKALIAHWRIAVCFENRVTKAIAYFSMQCKINQLNTWRIVAIYISDSYSVCFKVPCQAFRCLRLWLTSCYRFVHLSLEVTINKRWREFSKAEELLHLLRFTLLVCFFFGTLGMCVWFFL